MRVSHCCVYSTEQLLILICSYTLQLIAKCETRQALFAFPQIAAAADGICMSRGNLGLDVLPEKMALVQKAMVSACNLAGKPVLITRVVDTMVTAPRPTRYEALAPRHKHHWTCCWSSVCGALEPFERSLEHTVIRAPQNICCGGWLC